MEFLHITPALLLNSVAAGCIHTNTVPDIAVLAQHLLTIAVTLSLDGGTLNPRYRGKTTITKSGKTPKPDFQFKNQT